MIAAVALTGRNLLFRVMSDILRQRAANINYLVLSPGPPQTLGAYFKSGRIVIGDAHGRPQRTL